MTPPDDVIWTEIWRDGKRFNSISIYCNDGNIDNGDGCQGRCGYSNKSSCLKLELWILD